MPSKVILKKKAQKELLKVPVPIRVKFYTWVSLVKELGVSVVREHPGFRDKMLSGNRKGQRSIRLSRSYRAFYIEHKSEIELIEVIEVNKHEY